MITKPVFDALFSDYSFAEHNPMSCAMQKVLDLLQQKNLHKERNTLQSFYDSVHLRASGIETAEGKQKIVVELYDKFFRNAFPRMTERLGIVYTPVEVVDFIIKSVEDVLQHEFKSSLQDKGVHILDPFTGTGTFITRLLQSGIIPHDRLPEKYQSEIHANETSCSPTTSPLSTSNPPTTAYWQATLTEMFQTTFPTFPLKASA